MLLLSLLDVTFHSHPDKSGKLPVPAPQAIHGRRSGVLSSHKACVFSTFLHQQEHLGFEACLPPSEINPPESAGRSLHTEADSCGVAKKARLETLKPKIWNALRSAALFRVRRVSPSGGVVQEKPTTHLLVPPALQPLQQRQPPTPAAYMLPQGPRGWRGWKGRQKRLGPPQAAATGWQDGSLWAQPL